MEDSQMIYSGMGIGYWIITTVFGGTSVWGIIMWLLERKKRNLDTANVQQDIDDKEFEGLKKQIEFQDARILNYDAKLNTYEQLFDELRNNYLTIKKNKFEIEQKVLDLEKKLFLSKKSECLVDNCPNRITEKNINVK